MSTSQTASLRLFRIKFVGSLALMTAVSLLLWLINAWQDQAALYSYLPWNVLLAWLPVVFAIWLRQVLKRKLWSSWEAIAASLCWLIFLPNSFYMISDLIHLGNVPAEKILYDAVLFSSFVFTGLALGFTSLYVVHLELIKRFSALRAAAWVGIVFVLCGFAIYLGRDLRWNSWDILFNPGGLLFDISNSFMNSKVYATVVRTVLSFFAVLASMYGLIWSGTRLLQQGRRP
jgi:uncharacterized membrane protein